jgi:hypothetical protein
MKLQVTVERGFGTGRGLGVEGRYGALGTTLGEPGTDMWAELRLLLWWPVRFTATWKRINRPPAP